MICDTNKLIFIHIPKCGGTSVADLIEKDRHWQRCDRSIMYGWDPSTGLHLQHATASEIIAHQLIPTEKWKSYFKFSIVRDPYERFYSGFCWMRQHIRAPKAPIEQYVEQSGKFAKVFRESAGDWYRGDHRKTSYEFLHHDSKLAVDTVLRIENIKEEFSEMCANRFPFSKLPHSNPSHRKPGSFREMYGKEIPVSVKRYIETEYAIDFETFGYPYL